jgi:hypothetical protein
LADIALPADVWLPGDGALLTDIALPGDGALLTDFALLEAALLPRDARCWPISRCRVMTRCWPTAVGDTRCWMLRCCDIALPGDAALLDALLADAGCCCAAGHPAGRCCAAGRHPARAGRFPLVLCSCCADMSIHRKTFCDVCATLSNAKPKEPTPVSTSAVASINPSLCVIVCLLR